MNAKKYNVFVLLISGLILGVWGCVIVVVDPYFHYHKPLDSISYIISNGYYINNGIVKSFDYDAIITGTSMIENFKNSEFDNLFGVKSIKVPFAGERYKRINDNLATALDNNKNIRYIIRGLDADYFIFDKNELKHEQEFYPWYLYDDRIINDVSYWFNKEIMINALIPAVFNTIQGIPMTTFDEYANWENNFLYGKEYVDKNYVRPDKSSMALTDEDILRMEDNVRQNVVALARDNPNVEFYYFIPPYSIYWWDSLYMTGKLDSQVQVLERASEYMLEYENIHLFCFFDEYDLICNLDNYKDIAHYSGEVNSKILEWMYNGEHELTKENNEDYWETVLEFYRDYPYDDMFIDDK